MEMAQLRLVRHLGQGLRIGVCASADQASERRRKIPEVSGQQEVRWIGLQRTCQQVERMIANFGIG